MPNTFDQLAARHHVLESADTNPFQQRARLLQSLWRQQQRLPIGTQTTPRGGQRPLGSRLSMPDAQTHLQNFLSETIQSVIRDEVLNYKASKGKLYKRPRIFNDLLSTQALGFNLFGELQRNLDLATSTFRSIAAERIHAVNSIQFEYSPAGNAAFEIFVQYTTPAGGKGFVGITVKYHEDLSGEPAPHRDSYDELAGRLGWFHSSDLARLRQSPLQQLWRDHLLVGSTQLAGQYDDAFFLFLYPEQNIPCRDAAAAYAGTLATADSFSAITLEAFARRVRPHTKDPWLDRFQDRYLNFPKIDAILAKSARE